MSKKSLYTRNQLRDYSSLFSRSQAQLWMQDDFTSIIQKIERYDGHWLDADNATFIDYLKHVYSILEAYYQNEYIFKNAFLNEWLIKEVCQTDSKVINEYRVGSAVADLVIFNGVSKVFEIKTAFDSDSRLASQLENYKKAFNQIYLIVPESKILLYSKYDQEIGLIAFHPELRQKFELQREATINIEVEPDTIMQLLLTHEYKAITQSYYGSLPRMTSFNQFNVCKELILPIPNIELNVLFIEQMKLRDKSNVISNRCYREFNQLTLALKSSKTERDTMIQKLKSPLR